ncbi:UvrC family transcriptional regulator [Enterococcus faecalis M7]|nr:UvrC family transcriptional regulator [Enterococcus faecalis M7]
MNGTIIPLGDSARQVAYVECSCGCLASRVTNDSSKYKCSWCKRVYTLRKDHKTAR